VEQLGVFVLLAGDLGSYHSEISVDTFRGFTIADHVAPFIVINDRDARAAWSFTLLHELTHVWLGQSGFGATDDSLPDEQFCSDVASEYLLPAAELQEAFSQDTDDTSALLAWIDRFAAERNLSRSMVVYRLHRQGLVERSTWMELTAQFRADWMDNRERARQANRAAEGGPSYYTVRRHRVGHSLIGLVDRSIADGSLTTTKAGLVLGVKPKNVGTLIDAGR
jgi:Zn-dependent peptidase ImmA (M78 family)